MQQGSLTVPDTPPAMNRQGTTAEALRACGVPSARAGLLTGTSAPGFAFPNRADGAGPPVAEAVLSGQFSGVTDVQTGGGVQIPLKPAPCLQLRGQFHFGQLALRDAGTVCHAGPKGCRMMATGWRRQGLTDGGMRRTGCTGFPEWPGSGRADDGPRVTPARRLSGPAGSGGLCCDSSRRRTTPPENRAGDWRNQSSASIERRARRRQTKKMARAGAATGRGGRSQCLLLLRGITASRRVRRFPRSVSSPWPGHRPALSARTVWRHRLPGSASPCPWHSGAGT